MPPMMTPMMPNVQTLPPPPQPLEQDILFKQHVPHTTSLEVLRSTQIGSDDLYEITDDCEVILSFEGSQFTLFKFGDDDVNNVGKNEFDLFLQLCKNQDEMGVLTEEHGNSTQVGWASHLHTVCLDVVSTIKCLREKFKGSSDAHCEWFLYGRHHRPMFYDYLWMLRLKACEFILDRNRDGPKESIYTGVSDAKIKDINPLDADFDYYSE